MAGVCVTFYNAGAKIVSRSFVTAALYNHILKMYILRYYANIFSYLLFGQN